MRNRRISLVAALAVLLMAREAHADIWHMRSPSTLETEKGSVLQLPPGYFLDEGTWQERDLEMRRLQELEVRLKAENRSFRDSASDTPWLVAAATGGFGIVLGATLLWAATK
jgi:hypothetical protein